jgi:hypothetical protein
MIHLFTQAWCGFNPTIVTFSFGRVDLLSSIRRGYNNLFDKSVKEKVFENIHKPL